MDRQFKILDDLTDHISADVQTLSARLKMPKDQVLEVLGLRLREDYIMEEIAEGKIRYRLKR